MNQPELFPIETERPTNPLQEGFKCIYGGFNAYVAVFADHARYINSEPNWLEHVKAEIARQTTHSITVLYIHDKQTRQTHQGLIQ